MPTESDKPTVFDILGWEWDEKAEGLWWVEEAEEKKLDCEQIVTFYCCHETQLYQTARKKKKVY